MKQHILENGAVLLHPSTRHIIQSNDNSKMDRKSPEKTIYFLVEVFQQMTNYPKLKDPRPSTETSAIAEPKSAIADNMEADAVL